MSDLVRYDPSIDLIIAAWLDAKRGKSGSDRTLTAYRDTLGSFRSLLQSSGADLTADPQSIALAAQGWAGLRGPRARSTGDVAPATYNHRLAVLASFYDYAVKHQLIERNPIDMVERRHVPQSEPKYIPFTQLLTDLRAIDQTSPLGKRDYALAMVALTTGRRLNEIASWRWRDVQLEGARVNLTTRRTKGGDPMRDRLRPGASAALLAWLHSHYGANLGQLSPDAALWPRLSGRKDDSDQPITGRAIDNIIRKRFNAHPHVIRHSLARELKRRGASIYSVQSQLGHKNIATTDRYLRSMREDDDPTLDAIDQMLQEET